MTDFRVFGLPRSGTTWAANWLTTDKSICWHDPIEWALPGDVEEWAQRQDRMAGISCTGMWLHDAQWDCKAPTVVLERRIDEVQASLTRNGLPEFPEWAVQRFRALPYRRVNLRELLSPVKAREVWEYLLPALPFDEERHVQLRKMQIQPSAAEMQRARNMLTERTRLCSVR